MALTRPQAPPEGRTLILARMAQVGPGLGFPGQALATETAPPAEPQIDDPLEVFVLELADVAARETVRDRARPVAWRYLIWAGTQPYATAEVVFGPSHTSTVALSSRGPR